MPLDSSIPLQGREFRLMSPVEAQSQALQLRSLQAQEQQRQAQAMAAQRSQQDQARLSDLYRSNYNNPDEFDRSAAQSGLGHLLPGIQKGRAEIDEKRAKTKETEAQTKNFESIIAERGIDAVMKQTKHVVETMGWISNKPGLTDDDVIRALASSPPEMRGAAEQVMRTAPWGQGEGALKQWAMGLGRNAQQRWEDLNVTAAQKLQNDTAQRGQTLASETTRRGQNLANERSIESHKIQRERLSFEKEQPRGILVQGDDGPRISDPRTGTSIPITDKATGAQVGPKLKDVPASAQAGAMTNAANLRRAKDALALMSGNDVGVMKGDKNATGFKGYAPDWALNRFDAAGTDARAAIADLGSMVIHDRSGAAVTASEYPRLMPFIPKTNDDAATVKKKLARFVQVYEEEQNAFASTYNKDTGYKSRNEPPPPSSQIGKMPTVKDAAGYNAIPSGSQYTDPQGNVRTKR